MGCRDGCIVAAFVLPWFLRRLLRHLGLLRELGAAITPRAEGGPRQASEAETHVVFPFKVALEAVFHQCCLLDGP